MKKSIQELSHLNVTFVQLHLPIDLLSNDIGIFMKNMVKYLPQIQIHQLLSKKKHLKMRIRLLDKLKLRIS
uniref:CSON011358 protein n=1 Tax=Culicoides sonorensis TaxID=179676 RepID=A0A336NAG6_CULSO